MKIIRESYDERLGLVIIEGNQRFFLEHDAWWILDYQRYSPSIIDSETRTTDFRNGILLVDENNAEKFLEVMKDSEVLAKDVRRLILEARELMETDEDEEEFVLMFLIDFDKKLYVNGFFDFLVQPYEEFVPKGWTGILDNPLKYVSDDIKSLWE
jgi:hypothetical protein